MTMTMTMGTNGIQSGMLMDGPPFQLKSSRRMDEHNKRTLTWRRARVGGKGGGECNALSGEYANQDDAFPRARGTRHIRSVGEFGNKKVRGIYIRRRWRHVPKQVVVVVVVMSRREVCGGLTPA